MSVFAQWEQSNSVLVPRNLSYVGGAFFAGSASSDTFPVGIQERRWFTVDLGDGAHWNGADPGIPDVDNLQAVGINILMGLTHGGTEGIAEVRLTLRGAGGTDIRTSGTYQGQLMVSNTGVAGLRQQLYIIVPVFDRCFQLNWRRYHHGTTDYSGLTGVVNGQINALYYKG